MRCEQHERRTPGAETPARKAAVLALAALLPLSLIFGQSASGEEAGDAEDSCIECHSKRSLMVTNKKLYDYFQRWEMSIHRQEGVTCVDCHGGNQKLTDKKAAHGGNLNEAVSRSAVNFRNIPDTCGECHDEILDGFQKSEHFEHVLSEKQEDQGPTCVTCHGSINVAVLNVTTVEEICQRCHNQDTDSHPENPQEARALLNRLLSIHRYYRYITVRGEPAETKNFFDTVDKQLHDLSVTWHTFDLETISEKTEIVLKSLKEQREKVARAYKAKRDQGRKSAK